VLAEELWESCAVFQGAGIANCRSKSIDAGAGGSFAGEQAGAGGVAEWRLAMSIGEQGAGAGEGIDVGCACLGMAVEAADPVILVIDGNHQHIGRATARLLSVAAADCECEEGEEPADRSE
jgi:hypothetical protein